MRKRLALAALAATLVAAIAMPTFASGATRLTTNMTGSQVVNPNGGDPDGTSKLILRVNRVKERICFKLKSSGLGTITGAFIHKGDAGQIARPIITLFNTTEAGTGTLTGCEHNIRSRLIKRLKRKPSDHYADVTTRSYPDGAIRGQLRK